MTDEVTDEATADGTLGTRLRALREGAGLSQRALASRAGVAPETVARLEGDRTPTRPATLRKIAAALGVPPEVLAGGHVSAEPDADAAGLPVELRVALALNGIAPGPDGYDVAAIVAAIAARGWRSAVEERATRARGRFRYHAIVFGSTEGSSPSHASGRASGETEAERLAKALVRLLERTP
jgi:transcriptional regulator with XRE-family HTH domain